MASTSAKVAKDKGNASFRAGDFADAVGHYSAAIVSDRADPTYPLNRAAAYLKLGKYHDAERDCTTVLSLDGKNVKAFFRRAQARIALENLAGAEKDLSDALQLDPVNDSITQELATVKKRKVEIAKRHLSTNREPITVPQPSSPQSKAKNDVPPLKRITRNVPIEIFEGDEPPPAEPTSSKDLLKPVQSRVLSPSSTSQSIPSPPSTPTSSPSVPQAKPRVGAAIFRADGNHTIIRDPASSSSATTPTRSSPAPAPSHVSAPVRPSSPTPSPPLTHFAFSRAWYALSTAQERYNLLRRIPPESLPALFQTSLEPEFLVSIIQTFSVVASSPTISVIGEYMNAFPAVSRFATIILFLSTEEKAVVRKIWEALGDGHDAGRRVWGV